MSAAQQQHAASMVPSTFVEGGLWDDLDVEISDIAWTKFSFTKDGEPQNLKLSLAIEFWPLSGLEPGKEPYIEQFSAGDLKYFVPSADDAGGYAVQVGDKAAMNSSTNASEFLISLFECATPEQHAWLSEALAAGYCKNLVGMQFHLKRLPTKERKGLSAQEGAGERAKTALRATNIIALPGEATSVVTERASEPAAPQPLAKPAAPARPPATRPPVAAPKPAAAAPPARPAAPASGLAAGGKANGAAKQAAPSPVRTVAASEWTQERMSEKANEALLEVLNSHEGIVEFSEVPKQGFGTEALKAVPPKVRQQVLAIMYDEGWVAANPNVQYDPNTQTVALAG